MPVDSSAPRATAGAARIVFLDYLRIFAFASVLAGHKFHGLVREAANSDNAWLYWAGRGLLPLIQSGGAGVVVFFLVSGYIITQVLARESTPQFLVKRCLRIYPLYLVALLAEYALLRQHGRAPEPAVLLQQMLLLGDWLGTPYALAGVEWTLRLEITFYALMAVLRSAGLVAWRGGAGLPLAYALLIALLHASGPFPSHERWASGYLSLYLPFLLLGSVLCLRQQRAVGWPLVLAFAALVFTHYYAGLQAWQPAWLDAPFALLACGLFVLLWALRARLPGPAWVLALSELTYAVYLLHNWLFDVLRDAALRLGAGGALAPVAALLALGLVSALLVRLVERPGVRLGRWLAARLPAPTPLRPGWRARARKGARTAAPASSRN